MANRRAAVAAVAGRATSGRHLGMLAKRHRAETDCRRTRPATGQGEASVGRPVHAEPQNQ